MSFNTACLSGTWGKDCLRDCNCRNIDTVCNETSGCADCLDGFEGGDCHNDINECDNNPCDDHANCSNTIGTYKCVCHAGYTQYNSTVCEDFNECESVPCQNGGKCVNGNNAYSCSCMPGYNGTNCEIDINECSNSPCLNDGMCKDLVNKFRCVCVRGFTGKNCETGKMCSTAPCQNGGNCSTPDFNMFSCQCVLGYTGEMCETSKQLCTKTPCQNGGTCLENNNTRTCDCVAGYTGEDCETETDMYSHYGRFTITNHQYNDNLIKEASAQYQELSAEVNKQVHAVFDSSSIKSDVVAVTNITFSKGSVIASYQLVLKNEHTLGELTQIMKYHLESNSGKIGSFEVNAESIQFSDKPWKKSAGLVAIVIGSVIGLVFLILSVILGIHIVRTVRKHREPTPSPNDDEVVLPKYGTPHPVNRMFWQGRGNSMQMPRETPLQDALDEQRLNVISKAMGRFSNIVSNRVARFSQQVKGLFQNPAYPS
ncbi:hypothetical protein NP493_1845g00018 [Ridgeia piscesae]|uniref:Uncharacterized protein n=1 Tax=Ridgeia piscesae TaxID=27915 RepID=A0AAD9JSI3_RIDPI|nr:hypothetical protein NP493_1845g00018 [Ridgeia piscesae]